MLTRRFVATPETTRHPEEMYYCEGQTQQVWLGGARVREGPRIVRNFVITFAGQAMNSFQGLITLPIIIHYAGVGPYGAYVVLLSMANLVLGLLNYGMPYRYQRSL